jgi:putative ABC transport system substrate-binding protein
MTPRRVALAAAAAACLAALPLAALAQPGRLRRVGYLASGSPIGPAGSTRKALRELGWVEGQNIIVEHRFAAGRLDRLPALADELVRLEVDVIIATGSSAALAAKRATGSIPIVMGGVGDPVGIGLVASLARPGGNITGVAYSVGLETFGKALELFKEALPALRRIAVLSNPGNPSHPLAISEVERTARSLGLQLQLLEARRVEDFDGAFAAIAREGVGAVFVLTEALFLSQSERLAALVAKHRLASLFGARENVVLGGLMSYGPSLDEQARRTALFVDKILKGARPADLPIEQPTTFELVINLKTAKALGITMPQSLRLRADEVIE